MLFYFENLMSLTIINILIIIQWFFFVGRYSGDLLITYFQKMTSFWFTYLINNTIDAKTVSSILSLTIISTLTAAIRLHLEQNLKKENCSSNTNIVVKALVTAL